jgi:hypothetical protein
MVERSGEGGMGVAKDVTTLSAVVAASEVAESALASRVVADSRLGIRLQKHYVSRQKNEGNNV